MFGVRPSSWLNLRNTQHATRSPPVAVQALACSFRAAAAHSLRSSGRRHAKIMEGGIVLIILLVLGVPLALAIWLIIRVVQARGEIQELSGRLRSIEAELLRQKKAREPAPAAEAPEPEPIKPIEPPITHRPAAPPVFT